MSAGQKPNDETLIRRIVTLERRLKEMEKTTAGLVFMHADGPPGGMVLTNVDQDISGCSLAITRPGLYLIWFVSRIGWSVVGAAGDFAQVHAAGTNFAALDTGAFAMLAGAALSGGGTTVSQAVQGAWQVPGTVKLQAKINAAGGTCTVLTNHSKIVAIRTGPA